VQFLIDQGTDVNATSKQGYTPLDVAMGKTIVLQLPVPQESTVALLKKLGGKEGLARAALAHLPRLRARRDPSYSVRSATSASRCVARRAGT
jgi:hypothetical protein